MSRALFYLDIAVFPGTLFFAFIHDTRLIQAVCGNIHIAGHSGMTARQKEICAEDDR